MNEREIAEIRRRFRPDKSNITHIRGCYVNENREIVSQFDQSLALMPQEDAEKILTILKRTLSGTLEKNLMTITFETAQVVSGEEHRLLMDLRESALENQETVQAFFDKVIQAVSIQGNYLILLAYDKYDVPYRSRDGQNNEDAASEVFSYFLCSICPVKMTKPALGYYVNENTFHNCSIDWLVSPPELGFLFPAFDDRSTNIYNALYYSRNAAENHPEFVQAVFQAPAPMPAQEQKETFGAILGQTLSQECSLEVMQTVHETLCTVIEEHKANREEVPLAVSKDTVKRVLTSCGVDPQRVQAFEEKYAEEFGEDASLSPKNLVDAGRLEVVTPSVKIQVSPQCGHMVESRVIDGVKYILIRADEGVQVNGVDVHIS